MTTVAADLTAREREVAALVCEDLSNAEIAERLVMSIHTVDAHVDRIHRVKGDVLDRSRQRGALWRAVFGGER